MSISQILAILLASSILFLIAITPAIHNNKCNKQGGESIQTINGFICIKKDSIIEDNDE